MIFVTVGTQLPFDRLIRFIDDWAFKNPNINIFAQIGESDFVPTNLEYKKHLSMNEFNSLFESSEFIVSHAGMGTIISALLAQKPIVIIARDSDLGEHRNQHQKATLNRFTGVDGCITCKDEVELDYAMKSRKNFKAGAANSKNVEFSNKLATRLNIK
jgi:UDP-N-acetylglucosamine transferase subunit ALG13